MKQVLCPSGATRNWQPPPRYVFWRHGRIARTFGQLFHQIKGGYPEASNEEKGAMILESLNDDEARRYQAYVEDVFVHSGSLNEGETIDRVPEVDLWYIFGLSTHIIEETPIETKEGETDAETVESFSSESEFSPIREDVQEASSASVGAHGSP